MGLVGSLTLHDRIDQLVDAAAIGPLAPSCSDADFLRRISLDLTGVIPSSDRVRAFLADSSSEKRRQLIDELLAGPEFVRHMTVQFSVWLLERRSNGNIGVEDWERYLFRTIDEGASLEQLFRELISEDGTDPARRPAANFILSRDAETNAVTRAVGRLVFGMDLQCAQCHDHPLVSDYYQEDYYGLYAFLHRTNLFTDKTSKQVQLAEKAAGEASFKSVFTGNSRDKTVPRLPKGVALPHEPRFREGEEYQVKPANNVRPVPHFSRRQALASMLAESRHFQRNIANRVWAQMFGRGIVHPVDLHHSANPPVNPALLKHLAEALQANGFQLRPLLRGIALSRAYQRACEVPLPETVNFADITARAEQLSRERDAKSLSLAPLRESYASAAAAHQEALARHEKLVAAVTTLENGVGENRKKLKTALDERNSNEQSLSQLQEQFQAVASFQIKMNEIVAKLPEDKELAEAAAKVTERATSLATRVRVGKESLAAAVLRHHTVAGQLADAEKALAEGLESMARVDTVVRLDQLQIAASEKLEEATFELDSIRSRLALCESLREFAALDKQDTAKAAAAWQSIVERWTIAGQVAPLKPLTPEQLAASTMQATGMFVPQWTAAVTKVDRSPAEELKSASAADQARIKSRLVQLELLSQLRGTFNEFVTQYGGVSGVDFQATVSQALFIGNGSLVDAWLRPSGDNLAARLAKAVDPGSQAEELYLAILSRLPNEAEKQDIAGLLKESHANRTQAIAEMIWALLSASEFRFNH